MKRPELEWTEVEPTDAEELKAHRRRIRPALGKECHTRPERYYRGEDVIWTDRPGTIMLAGLHLLPHPKECAEIEAEGEIEIVVDGVAFKGYRDLLVKRLDSGRWLLIDHKTTYSFDYIDRDKTIKSVKTADELKRDTQANLYAYDVMRSKGLTELDCRWVYYRTEGVPAAVAVDFTITWAEAEAVVKRLVAEARGLLAHIGRAKECGRSLPLVREYVDSLEGNPDACPMFGGCEYHPDAGGPCSPPTISPGQRMARQAERRKIKAAQPPPVKKERRKTMGFRTAKAAADAVKTESPTEPAPPPENTGPTGYDSTPKEEAPKTRAPRAPRTKTLESLVADLRAAQEAVDILKNQIREAL
jgi:hypothetical protein